MEFPWKSDAFKKGSDILAEPLCDIIKAFLVHGFAPEIFISCILVPIVKNNRASKSKSSNYRLIAISSLILKLFDKILLELFTMELTPSDHQFGFRKGSSTTFCTWTLLETINYYRNRGGPVYICLLDLTKAFDLVRFSTLFNKLSDRLPAIFIRLIIFSYITQDCSVRWDQYTSSKFKVSNGVRQGSVSSPTYFNIYIDEIFTLLKESGCGCYIGDTYYGGIAYADDVTLMSPTREGLQKMVSICESYFSHLGIKISVDRDITKSKTKCMVFPDTYQPAPIKLYDLQVPFVKTSEHLGHVISNDENTEHDINQKRREFISKYHTLQQELGAQSPVVLITLVNVFFTHFYGHCLWNISSPAAESLWKAWNSMIRVIYNLSPRTHCYITEGVSNSKHIKLRLMERFSKFSERLKESSNLLIHNLLAYQKYDQRSTFGMNCRVISRAAQGVTVYQIPEGGQNTTDMVKELIDVRSGLSVIQGWDSPELDCVLEDICTN